MENLRLLKRQRISLGDIVAVHPAVHKRAGADYWNPYTLRSAGEFSPEALTLLMTLHPICVTKTDSKFHLVAGLRTWQIYCAIRATDQTQTLKDYKTEVLVFEGESNDIANLYLADLYSTHLAFSLNPTELPRLAAIWEGTQEIAFSMTPKLTTRRAFAKALGRENRIFKKNSAHGQPK